MHNSSEKAHFLEQNCREEWPTWICIFSNVCGLISTSLWFIVLLPQVLKNFRRKSVAGLSILWATSNFTASLINLFFVFLYAEIPIYDQINSVYMPILEFTILIQFWIYDHTSKKRYKLSYAGFCLTVWALIISLNLVLHIYSELQWVAIALWCVETFPQVFLNFKLHSTAGQSTPSVVIALVGKLTDFISTYGLLLPVQYVIMTYFSSSVAYVNGIQVVWYYRKNKTQISPFDYTHYGMVEEEDHDVKDDAHHALVEGEGHDDTTSLRQSRFIPLSSRQLCFISLLICCLALYAYGVIWATHSYISILAPSSLLLITLGAMLYYNREEVSRRSCLCHDRQSVEYYVN